MQGFITRGTLPSHIRKVASKQAVVEVRQQLALLEARRNAIEHEVAAEWEAMIVGYEAHPLSTGQRIEAAIHKCGMDNITTLIREAGVARGTMYRYLKRRGYTIDVRERRDIDPSDVKWPVKREGEL